MGSCRSPVPGDALANLDCAAVWRAAPVWLHITANAASLVAVAESASPGKYDHVHIIVERKSREALACLSLFTSMIRSADVKLDGKYIILHNKILTR